MTTNKEYAFQVTLVTSLRVTAETRKEASDKLKAALDGASANFGELDGETLVADVSVEGDLDLIED